MTFDEFKAVVQAAAPGLMWRFEDPEDVGGEFHGHGTRSEVTDDAIDDGSVSYIYVQSDDGVFCYCHQSIAGCDDTVAHAFSEAGPADALRKLFASVRNKAAAMEVALDFIDDDAAALAPTPAPSPALAPLCNAALKRGADVQTYEMTIPPELAEKVAPPCEECGGACDGTCRP